MNSSSGGAVSREPDAVIVVERVAREGYKATQMEGPAAPELEKYAKDVLDLLGQPDPNGAREYFRYVGPIGNSGRNVCVHVSVLANGAARFVQYWFPATPTASQHKAWLAGSALLGMLCCLLLGVSVVLAYHKRPNGPERTPPGPNGTDRLPEDLRDAIDKTTEVREEFRNVLQRSVDAADGEVGSSDDRAVKVKVEVEVALPENGGDKKYESRHFESSSDEARELLNLLECLDELEIRAMEAGHGASTNEESLEP